MGKHSQVWFVLLNRVPWDVILDGSHLAKADKEKQEATEGICAALKISWMFFNDILCSIFHVCLLFLFVCLFVVFVCLFVCLFPLPL